MTSWQRRAPVVRAIVSCQEEEHLVVWRRGSLALAHHDIGAEEVLDALGAPPLPCFEVMRLWRAGAVRSRTPDHVYFTGTEVHLVHFARRRPVLPPLLRRIRLLTMEPHDDVARRAAVALRSTVPAGVGMAVTVGDAPDLRVRSDRIQLTLPLRWSTNVWARGMEVADGRFVVDVATRPGDDGRLQVTVLEWNEAEPRLMTQRL